MELKILAVPSLLSFIIISLLLEITVVFCKPLKNTDGDFSSPKKTKISGDVLWLTEDLTTTIQPPNPLDDKNSEQIDDDDTNLRVSEKENKLLWHFYHYLVNLTNHDDQLLDDPDQQPLNDQSFSSSEDKKKVRELQDFSSRKTETNLSESETESRARVKEMYINDFKKKVEEFTGCPKFNGCPGKDPPVSYPITKEEREKIHNIFENGLKNGGNTTPLNYRESSLTLKSVCSVPPQTAEKLWNDNSVSLNLYFEVNFPDPAETNVINITSSVLRMYKIKPNSTDFKVGPENEKKQTVTVNVYYYSRPLKIRKEVPTGKKRLLVSKKLPLEVEMWTEWSMQRAVEHWRNDTSKNFGISIEVEDENKKSLSANKFFVTKNCSDLSSKESLVFPTAFIMSLMPKEREEFLKLFPLSNDPALDISWQEIPAYNVFLPNVKKISNKKHDPKEHKNKHGHNVQHNKKEINTA